MSAPQPADVPQTPEDAFLFACYYFGTAAGWPREKCERAAEFWWPLAYYQARGIPMGSQWDILGKLASRYARRFTTAQLADELWEVIEASPQGHGYGRDGPWRRWQILDIAQRAKKFTSQEDAKQAEFDRQVWLAAQPWLRTLELPPPSFAQMHRQARRMGVQA